MSTKRGKGRTLFTCDRCAQHKRKYRFAQKWAYTRHMRMWHGQSAAAEA